MLLFSDLLIWLNLYDDQIACQCWCRQSANTWHTKLKSGASNLHGAGASNLQDNTVGTGSDSGACSTIWASCLKFSACSSTCASWWEMRKIQKAAAPKRQTAAAMQITDWYFFRYSFIGFSFPFSSKINLASFRLVYLVWSVCCFGAGNSLQYSGYLTLMPSMK